VKKIVLTSSVAAIYPGHPKDKFEFTEDDWAILNDPKNPITTYEKSKYLAEKEAWKIWNDKKG
jgi:nucleoside-diphosphate-sugar epimerase